MTVFFHTPSHAAPKEAAFKEKLIQMDLPGAALVMGAIISFILAMEKGGQTSSWDSSVVIGLLVGSALMTIAFIGLELWMGDTGMIPPRIFKMRSVWVGGWFQFQHATSRPDFVTLGKCMTAGGAAGGAVVVSSRVVDLLEGSWQSYSTYRAHPVAMASLR